MSWADLTVSAYVVSAMCGCWWQESNCNPAIWESLIPCEWDFEYDYTNKGGYGLGQWTNVGSSHGRLWNLHTWVTSNGYTDGDGYGQLEFMLVENHWSGTSKKLGYTTLQEFLESTSTNIDYLVYDFLQCWEGVEGNQYEKRKKNAYKILNYIVLHQDDETQYEWIASNNYLTENQIYNNAMVIYQYISNGFAKRIKSKMPLWMMTLKRRV